MSATSTQRDYFQDKVQQVEPGAFLAFGISLSSRYGKAHELTAMLQFSERLARAGVAHYVREVLYDSKADICNIEVCEDVQEGDPVATAVHDAASSLFGMYQLLGEVIVTDAQEVE